jgi:predicted acetyltransferase
VVDVGAALAARGYPAGVEAELHLAVADDVLPANNASFVLRVAKGRGEVAPGGSGSLRLDVRALAALFAGYRSPAQLRMSTDLVGSDQDLALAATLFAGPAPWMPDGF